MPGAPPPVPPGEGGGLNDPRVGEFLEALAGGAIDVETLEKYAGSINLERLDTPEKVLQAIQYIARQHGGFQEARRGKITSDQRTELAFELGLTPKQLRMKPIGKAYNAEEIEAARLINLASAEVTLALSQKATETGAPADKMAYQLAYEKHQGIMAAIQGIATEAGRAMEAHKKKLQATAGLDALAIQAILDDANISNVNADEIMVRIAALQPHQLGTYVEKSKGATGMEMLREAWYMAILSNPATQAVNITSNLYVALATIPEHLLAGVYGKLHGGDKVYLRESAARIAGLVQGTRIGARMGWNTFWREEQQFSPAGKIEVDRYHAIPSLTLRRGKRAKQIWGLDIPFSGEIKIGGRQVRIPGRGLLAGDEFFKAIGYAQKIHELAVRDAIQKGKKGSARRKHIKNIINKPPASIHRQAMGAAHEQTFTEKLGKGGAALMTAREYIPFGWLWVPFMRTPTNIAKATIRRTPLPLFLPEKFSETKRMLKEGGVQRDIALGRMTFGTMIMGTMFALAQAGQITGAGPDDPAEKAAWRQLRKQPWSIKVGDTWYSYAYYEPLGSLIGLGALASEIVDVWPEVIDDDDYGRAAGMILFGVSKMITSKTFMRSVSDMLEAINDPDRYGSRWVRRLAGSVIPSGVAALARIEDPSLREARTILDTIRARIPSERGKLALHLDPRFGTEIKLGGSLGPDILSRVYTSKEKPDALIQTMIDVGAIPGRIGRKNGDVKLTDEQYNDYLRSSREPAMKLLREIQAGGGMPKSKFAARTLIKNTLKSYQRMAAEMLKVDYPSIGQEQLDDLLEEIGE